MLNDNIDKLYADGAYDNIALYKLLNARYTNYKDRNDNVRCIKQLGYKML